MPTFYETHFVPGTIPRLTYLRLFDANEQPWYLYASGAGDITLSTLAPVGDVLTGPDSFFWLTLQTPAFVPWYVYPSVQTPGQIIVASVPVSGRPGVSYRPWVLSDGVDQQWLLGLSGAAALMLTGGTVYVNGSHRIRACPRCPWVGHVDTSNARRGPDGMPRLDICPRDGSRLIEEHRLPPMPLPRHGRV